MIAIGNYDVIEVFYKKDMKGTSRRYIEYKCKDCGNTFTARYDDTKRKDATGLCRECMYLHRNTRPDGHGLSRHRLYSIWDHIVQRTSNPKCDSYNNYGGRGVSMCTEWREDFRVFYDWAMTHGYEDTLSIDRIDVNGNYTPDNCRWATNATQARNTRVLQKNNTSGYRGVSLYKSDGKYHAEIVVNYTSVNLGTFDTAEDAAYAYDFYVVSNNLEHNTNGVYKEHNDSNS